MILELVDEAISNGARLHKSADVLGLSARTIIRWRSQGGGHDRRNGPKSPPANKLSQQEQQTIIDVANSPEFRDLSPKQIVPKLADKNIYIASESSFYRVLRSIKCLITVNNPSRLFTIVPKNLWLPAPVKYGLGTSHICVPQYAEPSSICTCSLMSGAGKLLPLPFFKRSPWNIVHPCSPKLAWFIGSILPGLRCTLTTGGQ